MPGAGGGPRGSRPPAKSLVYANVETGCRSGGFSAATAFETYEPEYITAYTVGNLPQQMVQSNRRTNAQVSIGSADDRFSISAFVRNIETDRIPAYLSTQPIANILIAGTMSPRTCGARAAVRF